MLKKYIFVTTIKTDCLCQEDAFREFKKLLQYDSTKEYYANYNFKINFYEIYEILPK